jgi:hypothetical protein
MVCPRVAMDETRNSMGPNRIANVPPIAWEIASFVEVFYKKQQHTKRDNLQDELFAPFSGRKIFQIIHSIIWLAFSVTYSKEIN